MTFSLRHSNVRWIKTIKLLKRNREMFQRRIKANKTYVSSRVFPSDFKLLRKSCHYLRLGSSLLFTSYKLSKNHFTKFCWNHDSWLIIKTTLKSIEPTSRSSRIFHSDFLWQSCLDLMLGSSLLFTSCKLSKTYFMKFCWNHDKSFQRFIEPAAFASLVDFMLWQRRFETENPRFPK